MFSKPKAWPAVLICANVALPLIVGAAIYILSDDSTLIGRFAHSVCPVQIPAVYFPPFIRNWGCDFLWAYSLTFSLFWLWPRSSHPYRGPILVAIISGVIIEASQLAVPAWGTFDWGDMIVQAVGTAAAALLMENFSKIQSWRR